MYIPFNSAPRGLKLTWDVRKNFSVNTSLPGKAFVEEDETNTPILECAYSTNFRILAERPLDVFHL